MRPDDEHDDTRVIAQTAGLRHFLEKAGVDPSSEYGRFLCELAARGRHDLVSRMTRTLIRPAAMRAFDGHCFYLRNGLPTTGVLFGAQSDGRHEDGDVRTPPFSQPVLIAGTTGSGKTTLGLDLAAQLIDSGCIVQIIDPQDDYLRLLSKYSREKLARFRIKDFRINPNRVPPGRTPKEWIARLSDLSQVYFVQEGSNLIGRALDELFLEHGIYHGTTHWPTPSELLRRLRTYRFGAGTRMAYYVESAIKVAELLSKRMGETYDVRESMPIQKLASQSMVISVRGVSNLDLEFFVALFIEITTGQHDRQRVIFFDEAHLVLNKQRSNRLGLTESPLEQAIRMLRKTKTAFVILDQAPGVLPHGSRSNFTTIATLRLPNWEDRDYVAGAMGLSREQADAITNLPPRMGIVSSAAFSGPVLFRARDMPTVPLPDPELLQREMDELIAREFPSTPATPTPLAQTAENTAAATTSAGPTPEEKRVQAAELSYLISVARSPYVPSTVFDRRHGYSAAKGNGLREQLRMSGLVTYVDVPTGRKGGRLRVIEITEQGWRRLEELAVNEEKPRGRGDVATRAMSYAVARDLKRRNPTAKVGIERPWNGKAVDVLFELNGKRMAYELQVKSASAHASENLVRDAEAGFDEVVFVALTTRGLAEIEKRLQQDLGNDARGAAAIAKARFQVFADFLAVYKDDDTSAGQQEHGGQQEADKNEKDDVQEAEQKDEGQREHDGNGSAAASEGESGDWSQLEDEVRDDERDSGAEDGASEGKSDRGDDGDDKVSQGP